MTTKVTAPRKKAAKLLPRRQRGGHKPALAPELQLITRGMRARPDEWARFIALVDIENAEMTEDEKRLSERLLFSRLIMQAVDRIDPANRAAFDKLRKSHLARLTKANAARGRVS